MRLPYRTLVIAVLLVGGTSFVRGETLLGNNPNCDPNGPATVDLYLRSNFDDLGPLFCPRADSFVSAQGASFSAIDSLPTSQNSVSLDGLAALVVREYGKAPFNGISFGVYAQGSGTYQLQPTPTQARVGDTATSGLFTQTSFGNPLVAALGGGGFDSFRLRGGDVVSSTGTNSSTVVGEWFPVYSISGPLRFGDKYDIPTTPFYYILNPEVMVQYDSFISGPKTYRLFAVNDEALRIGPQVAIQLGINEKLLPQGWNPAIRDVLGFTTTLVTFHQSWDVYTHRPSSFTSVSTTYSFGKDRHFGISLGYSNGNSETTGNGGSQVKLGLSAKL